MREYLNVLPDWDAVPMPHHETPILSFFTGAGFLDLGFEQEGFKVIWSNEYEEWFRKGYACGMSKTLGHSVEISNGSSIVDIGPNQIAQEAFNGARPPFFGIVGGPPCPDFSIGGKNKGEHGVNGRLSEVYVDRICELRPAFFVFENVKGLVNTGKHLEYLKRLIRQLEGNQYIVDYLLLNALELGVPQDRERVFIVGINHKWARAHHLGLKPGDREWFRYPKDERYRGAKTRWAWPSTSPFGVVDNPRPEGIPENLTVWGAIGDLANSSDLPNSCDCFRPYSKKFSEIPEGATSQKSFKRLHRWRYSPTAAYGNNEVHLHPTLQRRLTVREALRIQSAPDSYCLPDGMPLSYKFKTVGNAVPVRLARAVAHSIRIYMGL
ncbi:DNA cytosine methyltransferase [Geomonas subterranea]|uniref:DNA cytosine methyltransferase n=1 Tax=Geomonas subterranea TaxID=2847989 RepID=UPI001CD2A8B6|nr:DNA cytosine methyltransferase [Geomonas fuzhouensis]